MIKKTAWLHDVEILTAPCFMTKESIDDENISKTSLLLFSLLPIYVLSAWYLHVASHVTLSAILWSVHLYAPVIRSSSSVYSAFKSLNPPLLASTVLFHISHHTLDPNCFCSVGIGNAFSSGSSFAAHPESFVCWTTPHSVVGDLLQLVLTKHVHLTIGRSASDLVPLFSVSLSRYLFSL